MTTAYLSLGSNLGDRERYLREALSLMEGEALVVSRVSSVYETEPIELSDQPWFLNIVAEVKTSLDPLELLRRCQDVESRLGRQRKIPKGPRTVDIDILLYGDEAIDSADIVIPHPAIPDRRFVLEPLAELAPDFTIPDSGARISDLLKSLHGQTARKMRRFER